MFVITVVVHGWGGVFNRFSPDMLSNDGYGVGGSNHFYDENELNENLLEDQGHSCYGKTCTSNEFCCPDYVCVDVEGSEIGRCFMAYGKHAGETCHRDSDCESGLVCRETSDRGHVCSSPIHEVKLYGESCHMSSECDISNGLCCQLQRRHRQAPRKVHVLGFKAIYLFDFDFSYRSVHTFAIR